VTDPGEAYDGPAELVCDGRALPVTVALRSVFQPIDGRLHWYGRVQHSPAVDDLVSSGQRVALRTPSGEAPARLSDVDPWGRYRVTGTGRPPWSSAAGA
jgi:hypothetical protein